MTRQRKWFLIIGLSTGVLGILCAIIGFSLQRKISRRLEQGWVIPPLEIYSQGIALAESRHFPMALLREEWRRLGLSEGRDFEFMSVEACARKSAVRLGPESLNCLWIREPETVIGIDDQEWIKELWRRDDDWLRQKSLALYPKLVTQFFNGQAILQEPTEINKTPLYCLQAVTAIEDRDFLSHPGVSLTGIARAMLRNLKAGRFAEGGSTITQQLVKNFYLNSRKTVRRKLEEQALAVMLESQLDKDKILEMYLNVIYMGQSGPYQVLGFASAARYYFNKALAQLNLPECALLAALVNSPGRFSPWTQPEAAQNRRKLVLNKMLEAEMITSEDMALAELAPLPQANDRGHMTPAPYFVQSTLKEFESLDLDAEFGARLFTTLDPVVHAFAMRAVEAIMPQVEARVPEKPQSSLQVAVIVADVHSGEVLSLIGGRNYRQTQFNRAVDAKRQIGSIMKPFVYWAALQSESPLTEVDDSPFTWEFEGREWTPKNYDNKFRGKIPYFYALANSINVPAARVGQEFGLDELRDLLVRVGFSPPDHPLPSMTLGAMEATPWQVAQAGLTLARLGESAKLHTLRGVQDVSGRWLYEYTPSTEKLLDRATTATLVGMMRQSFENGTARAARLMGVSGAFAGKTGTTSDSRDNWFMGFDQRLIALVWVGYDDNSPTGLTGASAALPIWSGIVRPLQEVLKPMDFDWPATVEVRTLSRASLMNEFHSLSHIEEAIQLVFRR